MGEPTQRDLGTLLVNTGVQMLRVRESFDRFETLGIDWREVLREYAGWRDALVSEPGGPSWAKVKAVRAVGGLELVVAVDTLAGPAEHGCIVEHEAQAERGSSQQVVVSVPMAVDSDSEAEPGQVEWKPLTLGTFELYSAPGRRARPVTVILDIGNSRSTVGILEGGEGSADLTRDLTLVPLGARGAPPEFRDAIAESTFELVSPEWETDREVVRFSSRRETRVREAWRLFRDASPARIGREARRLRFESGFLHGLRTGMSSPKRYLWSRSPTQGPWFVHARGDAEPAALAGRLLRLLGDPGSYAASEHGALPRSQMMTLFIFELLLQAFAWINSVEYRTGRGGRQRREIGSVVVTFPSGMVAEETGIYQARAQQALDALFRLVLEPSGCREAELVEMYLDEGSAAQLAFVSDRTRAGVSSWQEWTESIGAAHSTVRIGCLDIGGGSIDASAIEYRLAPEVIPFHLDCELLYVDGVSRGGDDVLKAIIERLLIPELARQMNCAAAELEALVYADPRADDDSTTLAARIIQGLLYPLGLEILRAAEKGVERVSIPVGAVAGVDNRLLAEIPRAFEAASPGRIYAPLQTASVEVTGAELETVVRETVGQVLGPLAKALVREGCDVIVFAGRLSLLRAIVDIVGEATGWPRDRLVPLHETPSFARLMGSLSGTPDAADPKLAVIVGAAVSECARANRTMNGVKFAVGRNRIRERGHYWGIVTPEERSFARDDNLLFHPSERGETGRASVRQLTGAAFVGRRLTASSGLEASPVYELLPRRPGFHRHDVCFRLQRDPGDGEETIALSADGETCDESQGPVRFRLKTIFADEYWLDGNMGELGEPWAGE